MDNGKKVLIFGVSGFVGHYLAEEFHNNGYDVFGCDLERTPNLNDYIKFENCDILDKDAVVKCVSLIKPDYIVNLAAISSVGQSWNNPQKTVAINVEGAINILEAVRLFAPFVKVLLIGSSEEYAASDFPISESSPLDASNPYGISKIMQEKYAELYRLRYKMNVFYVRAFNHIGPMQSDRFVIPSWCKQISGIAKGEQEPIMHIGNTLVKRDFSDVRDVVRAYRMIVENGNCERVYNVGSGKIVCLSDILNHLISLSNKEITIVPDESLVRKNEAPVIWCDNSLIKTELGWEPEYSLFDTLTEIYYTYFEKT
ncbi:MAG: GDP-mannose 4,6-dehydratase [Oscillospiraceae bacterium]